MSTRDCPIHNLEMPCFKCKHANDTARGKGRRQRLREAQPFKPMGYILTGSPDLKDLERFAKRVGEDPIRFAALAADSRRPFGHSKERHGIALRNAARDPILSANPESIRLGLDPNRSIEYIQKHRPALAERVASMIVKPTCLMTSKYGRNNSFWGDRLWHVWSLKYAKGYLIVTDLRDYTSTFKTIGELMSATEKSGWKIIK